MKQYIWVADPGHAWLKVPMTDIPTEVREKISAYSYKKDGVAYLEEDCDAPLFISYLKEKGIQFEMYEEDHLNSDHSCRSYARFK